MAITDKKHIFIIPESTNLFKRMSHNLEEKLFETFETYKTEHMEK